jgi:hypothetical protein
VEWLSGKPVELWPAPTELWGSWWSGGCTRLVSVPVGPGSSHSTWSWCPTGPDCQGESEWRGSGGRMCSWGSAGPEGWWAGVTGGGAGIPESCGTGSELGSGTVGGGDPGGPGAGGAGEGQVSQHGVGPKPGSQHG